MAFSSIVLATLTKSEKYFSIVSSSFSFICNGCNSSRDKKASKAFLLVIVVLDCVVITLTISSKKRFKRLTNCLSFSVVLSLRLLLLYLGYYLFYVFGSEIQRFEYKESTFFKMISFKFYLNLVYIIK